MNDKYADFMLFAILGLALWIPHNLQYGPMRLSIDSLQKCNLRGYHEGQDSPATA